MGNSIPELSVASTADLAKVPVQGGGPGALFVGLPNGQEAFIADTSRRIYILQPQVAVRSAVDNYLYVNTPDDPTRQWVLQGLWDKAISKIIYGIDMKVIQTINILPKMVIPKRPRVIGISSFEIITKDTVSVGPTISIGNNAPNYNNLVVSSAQTGLVTGAVNTFQNPPQGVISPASALDLTTEGVFLNISAGATATALICNFWFGVFVLGGQ